MALATVDKLLTTTRTVRKRLNFNRPVEPEIIQECLEIAIQARQTAPGAPADILGWVGSDTRSASYRNDGWTEI